MTIQEAVMALGKTQYNALKTGIVQSVDTQNLTCSVMVDRKGLTGLLLPKVKISNIPKQLATNGVVFFPTLQSEVLVGSADGSEDWHLLHAAAVEKIILHGENFKGLVKIDPLVERIKKIEKLLNDLLSDYKSHVHQFPELTISGGCDPVTGSFTGLANPDKVIKPTCTIEELQALTEDDIKNLQNPNILHG